MYAEKLNSALIMRVRNNVLLITHSPAQACMPTHPHAPTLACTQKVNQNFYATTAVQ
jgi:hypothetical protein